MVIDDITTTGEKMPKCECKHEYRHIRGSAVEIGDNRYSGVFFCIHCLRKVFQKKPNGEIFELN